MHLGFRFRADCHVTRLTALNALLNVCYLPIAANQLLIETKQLAQTRTTNRSLFCERYQYFEVGPCLHLIPVQKNGHTVSKNRNSRAFWLIRLAIIRFNPPF